ncbi:MAG: aminoglycoside 3'-phosphotransferase [Ruminiclostridium sp.]|nr:aminoglycoside 3'-phosphotransferase [Ruminiclostridium sp.]
MAKVYYIEKDSGYYLKTADKSTLEKEAKMTEFFHSKGLGTEVLDYISDEKDWLLTAAVTGDDCTHEKYLAEPEKLCDTVAAELRKLHETDFTGCPITDRTAEYLADAEKNYRKGMYDSSIFPKSYNCPSAKEAFDIFTSGKNALQSNVLLHGDYCLPNIILNDGKLSGFIDVGCGGVGDRHIDIFWGLWSLWYNLKTDKYCGRFLDAYGRDRADREVLKIIAAAEVFG